jgi:hypothetical protein
MERKVYKAPSVRVLGAVAELTKGENVGTGYVGTKDD